MEKLDVHPLQAGRALPHKPATEGNKPAKLKAIAAALKHCDKVILATDCDREGQLIGQEILDTALSRHRPARALHRSGPQVAASRCVTKLAAG